MYLVFILKYSNIRVFSIHTLNTFKSYHFQHCLRAYSTLRPERLIMVTVIQNLIRLIFPINRFLLQRPELNNNLKIS